MKHALMLREKVAWCKELPEDVFVNYVLYDRINSEDITDCRPFLRADYGACGRNESLGGNSGD